MQSYRSVALFRSRLLSRRMSKFANTKDFDYDLIVIGGGSGGMSCSKAAASLGAKVALFDFVKPSTQGGTWGIGGTCVNVGCVPKKLCHFSGLLGHSLHDAQAMGWKVSQGAHDWSAMIENVTDHVRMLNFRYRIGLKNKEVNYINALAKFVDRNTIEYTTKDEGVKRITAANIVISVGGRPLVPSNIPGALEYGITSDDIFYLKKPPGKTLCVGGSYIALENAGFLTELGYDVTVAARSILLRGFDRQCVAKIETTMKDLGTTIMSGFQPTSIVKLSSGKLQVTFMDTLGEGVQKIEMYDTVLFATGRTPDLKGLDLPAAGVTIADSGKLHVHNERTNISNIFAVGDVCDGKQELTPVAVRAGELLAKRLFGNSDVQMDYDNVATTVFTPFEYGNVGLGEEDAIKKYGAEDLEVYMFEFTTLELSAVHRFKHAKHGDEQDMGPSCMSKLVCVKSEGERVVGFHFIGPNAGEVTQGFALALKLGAKKSDFDSLVGIHPTDAESFCSLGVTRRSGKAWVADGGCGGGVCG